MHWELPVPWPVRGFAAYALLLVGWWCHAGARAKLGDAPGDRPWPRRPPQPGFWVGVAGLLLLQGSMLGVWYRAHGPVEALRLVELGGLAAAAAGAGLRAWAVAALGRHYTHEVGLRGGHVLVTHGPYAHLRHPGYVGTITVAAGTALFFGPSLPGLVYAVATTWLLVARMPIEDDMLARAFPKTGANRPMGQFGARRHRVRRRWARTPRPAEPRG
jgi:protein-S-isoprenylcysteine O-methyltransferase Ste14